MSINLQSPVSITESESLYTETDNLRKEKNLLAEKLQTLDNPSFSFNNLLLHPEKSQMLVGLQFNVLNALLKYVVKAESEMITKLSDLDQLIMTLVKLKHNINFDLIAHICNISKTTAIEYF